MVDRQSLSWLQKADLRRDSRTRTASHGKQAPAAAPGKPSKMLPEARAIAAASAKAQAKTSHGTLAASFAGACKIQRCCKGASQRL